MSDWEEDVSFQDVSDEESFYEPVKSTSSPFASRANNASNVDAVPASNAKGGKKKVEEIYQKKSQLEHILLRPDSYIGSTEPDTSPMWVYDKDQNRMVQRDITFVPGLYKIFDEILVNAADNKQRDPSMDSIKVTVNAETSEISIWNNGHGVPVQIHKEHQVYVPELIFGHLLTSSNYDDSQKKVTGGRNGYGAKLTNIFSSKFTVETADADTGLKFKQTFTNNMQSKGKPSITKCTSEFTKITFVPDLKLFNMEKLDDDTVALFTKRVYDLAGCTHRSVKVYFNGEKIKIKQFKDFVDLYIPEPEKKIYEVVNDRWEICVAESDGAFQQVSFVNSISTWKGGSHVKHVESRITKYLLEHLQKKNKSRKLTAAAVRNQLWVFVNALIENPAFGSQTKENLTSRQQTFGSKCDMSDAFLKKVSKSEIVTNILSFAKFKESKELKKNDGTKKIKISGVPKLEDANKAGSRYGSKCTLILTEGDSAKALAVSGLSVVGRDYYGVFPLRGKLLNVRDARADQIAKNNEITHVKQILGLKQRMNYTDTSSLRYGHVMIMTDQDHDGSHIKGLLINLFHHYWPSLLKIPGFLTQFITPIVKATKGKESKAFYTMPEYGSWKASLAEGTLSRWSIKYYKGLGTSTAKEAKEYFSEIDRHQIDFTWDESMAEDESIKLAFSKAKVEDRKKWLADFVQGTHMDYGTRELDSKVSYTDFVNKELILFSNADNARSIPNMMDGLKPGQRKILFSCFKRNVSKEVKVGQLSGIVSEMSSYHHGEQSLCSTIVNLAQDFVGSNNINLLIPSGQFGTRHMLGKDSASARYIYTRLNTITRKIFHPDDDAVLTYALDDGNPVEPVWYAPIIPMALVNGADGIGTGWSTNVPNFNPRELIACLRQLLQGAEIQSLDMIHPWYRGFRGSITLSAKKGYDVEGCVEILDAQTLHVTELPLRRATESYKEFLEGLVEKGDLITDFAAHHTDTTVDFEITTKDAADRLSETQWKKELKLTGSLALSNMVLFDERNALHRFESVREVLFRFFNQRLALYTKRKEHLIAQVSEVVSVLQNKARFIQLIVDGTLVVNNRSRTAIETDLEAFGFERDVRKEGGGFDYLLSMKIWSLTRERIEELNAQRETKEKELEFLQRVTEHEMWNTDLDALEDALLEFDASFAESTKTSSTTKRELVDSFESLSIGESKSKKTVKAKPTKTKGKSKVAVKKEPKPAATTIVKQEPEAPKSKVSALVSDYFPKAGASKGTDMSTLSLSERIKLARERREAMDTSLGEESVTDDISMEEKHDSPVKPMKPIASTKRATKRGVKAKKTLNKKAETPLKQLKQSKQSKQVNAMTPAGDSPALKRRRRRTPVVYIEEDSINSVPDASEESFHASDGIEETEGEFSSEFEE